MNKKNPVVVVLSILVLITLGFSSYLWVQNQKLEKNILNAKGASVINIRNYLSLTVHHLDMFSKNHEQASLALAVDHMLTSARMIKALIPLDEANEENWSFISSGLSSEVNQAITKINLNYYQNNGLSPEQLDTLAETRELIISILEVFPEEITLGNSPHVPLRADNLEKALTEMMAYKSTVRR